MSSQLGQTGSTLPLDPDGLLDELVRHGVFEEVLLSDRVWLTLSAPFQQLLAAGAMALPHLHLPALLMMAVARFLGPLDKVRLFEVTRIVHSFFPVGRRKGVPRRLRQVVREPSQLDAGRGFDMSELT